jgi:putative ABC transport system substrate-binding protein
VACLPLDEAVLMTFSADLFEAGKQTARLADQIRQGKKPSELPVETCDATLTVNLKTAKKLGLHIPDDILLSAKTIIR